MTMMSGCLSAPLCTPQNRQDCCISGVASSWLNQSVLQSEELVHCEQSSRGCCRCSTAHEHAVVIAHSKVIGHLHLPRSPHEATALCKTSWDMLVVAAGPAHLLASCNPLRLPHEACSSLVLTYHEACWW